MVLQRKDPHSQLVSNPFLESFGAVSTVLSDPLHLAVTRMVLVELFVIFHLVAPAEDTKKKHEKNIRNTKHLVNWFWKIMLLPPEIISFKFILPFIL